MKLEQKLTILNKYGLHVRPSTRLSETAKAFRSQIAVTTSDGRTADAKSLLGLISLGLRAGAEVIVTADGDDAAEAEQAIAALAADEFGVDYDG